MKNILLLLLPLMLLFSACDDNNNFVDLAAQAEEDEQLITAYLDSLQIDAIRHESGLYYQIEETGSGGSPTISSEVQVKYKGYLLDGTIFDQTPTNDTRFFQLRSVIRAWQIGIPLLEKGGKGTFFVPSNLGYGAFGSGNIPGNAVLIFETELIDFI
jgi:FKBP-type peptidyl-prolyl cis-trans isomerase FkpA